ncbi:MAG: response regulator [Desulfobacterales bacterium]|nr:response regulator [Desulfobacterales bacterium]
MVQESFTVYVVDDDKSVRTALKRLLGSVGYSVLTFESAEDFLNSASRLDEGCILLDIKLPGMTGFALQEKLASGGQKYPIIFMTAYENPRWRERAEKAGSVAYLKKPFNENLLFDAIQLARGKDI